MLRWYTIYESLSTRIFILKKSMFQVVITNLVNEL